MPRFFALRLPALAAAAALIAAPAGHAQLLAEGEPTDQSSLNPATAERNLERQGYTDVRMADEDPTDNEIEFLATNPEGQAVRVVTDTTTGSKLYEKPLQ